MVAQLLLSSLSHEHSIAKEAQQTTTLRIPMVVRSKTTLPIAMVARLKKLPHIAMAVWQTTMPGNAVAAQQMTLPHIIVAAHWKMSWLLHCLPLCRPLILLLAALLLRWLVVAWPPSNAATVLKCHPHWSIFFHRRHRRHCHHCHQRG
jgi:hypothetical protein